MIAPVNWFADGCMVLLDCCSLYRILALCNYYICGVYIFLFRTHLVLTTTYTRASSGSVVATFSTVQNNVDGEVYVVPRLLR